MSKDIFNKGSIFYEFKVGTRVIFMDTSQFCGMSGYIMDYDQNKMNFLVKLTTCSIRPQVQWVGISLVSIDKVYYRNEKLNSILDEQDIF